MTGPVDAIESDAAAGTEASPAADVRPKARSWLKQTLRWFVRPPPFGGLIGAVASFVLSMARVSWSARRSAGLSGGGAGSPASVRSRDAALSPAAGRRLRTSSSRPFSGVTTAALARTEPDRARDPPPGRTASRGGRGRPRRRDGWGWRRCVERRVDELNRRSLEDLAIDSSPHGRAGGDGTSSRSDRQPMRPGRRPPGCRSPAAGAGRAARWHRSRDDQDGGSGAAGQLGPRGLAQLEHGGRPSPSRASFNGLTSRPHRKRSVLSSPLGIQSGLLTSRRPYPCPVTACRAGPRRSVVPPGIWYGLLKTDGLGRGRLHP